MFWIYIVSIVLLNSYASINLLLLKDEIKEIRILSFIPVLNTVIVICLFLLELIYFIIKDKE